jgi:REP element-mobilizing transposase RayT
VHLLISEPKHGTPSTVLKMLKQRVSGLRRRKPRRWVSATQRSFQFALSTDRLPQFWQKRFYDFNVWSRKQKIEKLGYMHANPVTRGLVDDPKHWPWSSYAFYQQRGEVLIEVDPSRLNSADSPRGIQTAKAPRSETERWAPAKSKPGSVGHPPRSLPGANRRDARSARRPKDGLCRDDTLIQRGGELDGETKPRHLPG